MSVIDFTDTIIAKSDQLNAGDVVGEMTITITGGTKKEGDQPVHIRYEGDNGKPWKPCKSMRRLLAQAWGSKVDISGRKITLICDPTVTWGGQEVGGIRVKALSHIKKPMSIPLRISKTKVVTYKVQAIAMGDAPAPATAQTLKPDGDAAAAQGVDAYKAWLAGLSDDDKAPLKQYHKAWTLAAQEADKAKEPEDDETLTW